MDTNSSTTNESLSLHSTRSVPGDLMAEGAATARETERSWPETEPFSSRQYRVFVTFPDGDTADWTLSDMEAVRRAIITAPPAASVEVTLSVGVEVTLGYGTAAEVLA